MERTRGLDQSGYFSANNVHGQQRNFNANNLPASLRHDKTYKAAVQNQYFGPPKKMWIIDMLRIERIPNTKLYYFCEGWVRKVSLYGVIVSVEKNINGVGYRVDDGSAKVKCWMNNLLIAQLRQEKENLDNCASGISKMPALTMNDNYWCVKKPPAFTSTPIYQNIAKPVTSDCNQVPAKPKLSISGCYQLLEQLKPYTSGSIKIPPDPRPSTSGAFQSPVQPKPPTSGCIKIPPDPRPSTSGAIQSPVQSKPPTSGSIKIPPDPRPSTSGAIQSPVQPKPPTSGCIQVPAKRKPSNTACNQIPKKLKPHTSGCSLTPEKPKQHISDCNQIPSKPKPFTSGFYQKPAEPKAIMTGCNRVPDESKASTPDFKQVPAKSKVSETSNKLEAAKWLANNFCEGVDRIAYEFRLGDTVFVTGELCDFMGERVIRVYTIRLSTDPDEEGARRYELVHLYKNVYMKDKK